MFSALAVYRLYKTISFVEYAALRPARTVEFNVYFQSGGKGEKIKRGKETRLVVLVGTEEEPVENVDIAIFLPPEIELAKTTSGLRTCLQSATMDYPNYTMVQRLVDYLHMSTFETISFAVSSNKIGEHKIPVTVNGKGIRECLTSLTLNVVK